MRNHFHCTVGNISLINISTLFELISWVQYANSNDNEYHKLNINFFFKSY